MDKTIYERAILLLKDKVRLQAEQLFDDGIEVYNFDRYTTLSNLLDIFSIKAKALKHSEPLLDTRYYSRSVYKNLDKHQKKMLEKSLQGIHEDREENEVYYHGG